MMWIKIGNVSGLNTQGPRNITGSLRESLWESLWEGLWEGLREPFLRDVWDETRGRSRGGDRGWDRGAPGEGDAANPLCALSDPFFSPLEPSSCETTIRE